MSPALDTHAVTTVLHDPLWGKLAQVVPRQVSPDDARLLPPLSIRFCSHQAPRLRQKPSNLLYRRAIAGKVWAHLRELSIGPLPRVVFPQSSWSCDHTFSHGFVDIIFSDCAAHHAALHSLHLFEVDIRGSLIFEQIAWCGALPSGLYTVDCILIGRDSGTAASLMDARVDELSQKLEKIGDSVGDCKAVTRVDCKCCTGRETSPTAILRAWFKGKGQMTQLLKGVPPSVYLEDGTSYPLVVSGVPGCDQLSPSLAITSTSRAWKRLEYSPVNATATHIPEHVAATR